MNTLSTKSFSSKLPVSLAEKSIFLMYSVLTRARLFKAGLVQNLKSDNYESLKSKSSFIVFLYYLMISCPKINIIGPDKISS